MVLTISNLKKKIFLLIIYICISICYDQVVLFAHVSQFLRCSDRFLCNFNMQSRGDFSIGQSGNF